MTADTHAQRATSFGVAADAYERARPTYPEAAVDWLVPAGARRVLDLGAGTGKMSRLLVARGLDVVAVEPSDGMRAALEAAVPDVAVLAGTAESIPLPDGSVDAIVVAQAWHWVDAERASVECARVLRPGGRLGLTWNIRDLSVPWMAELEELLRRHGETDDDDDPVIGSPFGPVERDATRWRYPIAPEAVLDLVASRSYIIVMDEAERTAVLGEVRALVERWRASAPRGDIAVPYETRSFRAHRP